MTTARDNKLISSLNDETAAEEAFRIIDQEVDKHKECIVALWRRRNSFAPVSQLPPEILCRIFYFRSQDTTYIPLRVSLHWIQEVSHVSHGWSNIALNSPSLWTNPPLTNDRWMEKMLERSKMASLTLDIRHGTSPRFQNAASSALHHISRARSLNMTLGFLIDAKTLLHALPKSAPRLESLQIHIKDRDSLNVPADALCETERLRRLDLSNCIINWDSQLLVGSLTHLKIHDLPISARPTTIQLWNALRRMPSLESLDLQHALPVPNDPQHHSSSHPAIFLGCLEALTIMCSTRGVETFLKGISFHPTVTIKVVCSDTCGADFTGVLSALSTLLSPSTNSCGIKMSTLGVSHSANGSWFQTFSDIVPDIKSENEIIVPNLDLGFIVDKMYALGRASISPDKIMMDVGRAIPLGKLTTLDLGTPFYDDSISTCTIVDTFGTLPHLQSVSVMGMQAKNFILALQEFPPNQNSTNAGDLVASFPGLRSISIKNVLLQGPDAETTVTMLEECLTWRYEHGVPVHTLKIDDCLRITEEDVDLLHERVCEVDWDGLEGFTDSEEEEEEEDADESDDYYAGSLNSNGYWW